MSEARPIYRVLLDGEDIFDLSKQDLVLVNPNLTTELNTAGSFEFTLPPIHRAYDSVLPLTSTVEVYEDDSLLWYGRPVEIQKDYFMQKTVYCEGALAFCNDSVQRPHEYDEISLHQFFRTVFGDHNAQVAEERRLYPGRITLPDKTVYRKLNYDSTFDVLRRQCLNAEGGYFFLRREDGRNYIDWLSEMPFSCNQPVEFGLNLLAFSAKLDGSSICTCVLPLGETDTETGDALTIASINNGSDVIESEAVSVYGRITKAVTFSGVSNPETLLQDGEEYLQSTQFADTIIECSASELHWKNENYEQFRVGQIIRCHSVPHLLDREFPLTKLSIRLDTAAKQITLGTSVRQTLTRIYKEEIQEGGYEDNEPLNGDLNVIEERIDNLEELIEGIPGADTSELEETISEVQTDLGEAITGVRTDLNEAVTDLQAELEQSISGLQTDLGGSLSDVRSEVASLSNLVNGITDGSNDGWGHWFGTPSEYSALQSYDNHTIYFVQSTENVDDYFIEESLTI